MKKSTLRLALVPLLIGGCTMIDARVDRLLHGENPYEKTPFYARYLTTSSTLDRSIAEHVEALRKDPDNAPLHNSLGTLLLEKGFPKDAEREFRRAIAADPAIFPAWYNLGLVRESQGDWSGAASAFRQTIELRPGHPAAHFQLGLLFEKRGKTEAAIEHYARAYSINRALLDVRVNPRILDSKLTHRALLRTYEEQHAEASIRFQPTPTGLPARPATPEEGTAPSPEAPPANIVTPVPPATDPSQQPATPSRINQQPPKPKPNITSLPRWDTVPNATPPAEVPPPPPPPTTTNP